jgi:hypothetical protein
MIIVLPKWTEKPVVRLLAGFGLIIILLVGAALIWGPSAHQVPDTLVGEWVSSDPRYDDRVFEIDPVSVNFGTPGAKVTVGFVKSVTAEQDGGRTLYTIAFVQNNLPSQVSFYYDTSNGESIYFKNRQNVYWTRRPKVM